MNLLTKAFIIGSLPRILGVFEHYHFMTLSVKDTQNQKDYYRIEKIQRTMDMIQDQYERSKVKKSYEHLLDIIKHKYPELVDKQWQEQLNYHENFAKIRLIIEQDSEIAKAALDFENTVMQSDILQFCFTDIYNKMMEIEAKSDTLGVQYLNISNKNFGGQNNTKMNTTQISLFVGILFLSLSFMLIVLLVLIPLTKEIQQVLVALIALLSIFSFSSFKRLTNSM